MVKRAKCKHCDEWIERFEVRHDPNGHIKLIGNPFWIHSVSLNRHCVLRTNAEPAEDTEVEDV